MSRLAVVTGGIRGIGSAIALNLKNKGYDVATTYNNNKELATNFSKKYKIKTYSWNVSNYFECLRGIDNVEQDFNKPVDILINNAGITSDNMLHKMDFDNWHKVIETNLTSCYNMTKAVIGKMRNNKFGRIISISAVNGLTGQFGQTNYSASKAGIIGFSKALAKESAKKNITVNVVAPGYIETDMMQNVPKEILNNIISQIPAGRLGKPEEIARVVSFLASDDSSFITGATISVNGGQYMQ